MKATIIRMVAMGALVALILWEARRNDNAVPQHSDEAARAVADTLSTPPDSLPGGAPDSTTHSRVAPPRGSVIRQSAEPAPTGNEPLAIAAPPELLDPLTPPMQTRVILAGFEPGMYAIHRDVEDHTTFLAATARPSSRVIAIPADETVGVFVLTRTRRCVCVNGQEVAR